MHPAVEESGGDLDRLRGIDRGPVPAESMHLLFPDRARWIADRMEGPTPPLDAARLLQSLYTAVLFEHALPAAARD